MYLKNLQWSHERFRHWEICSFPRRVRVLQAAFKATAVLLVFSVTLAARLWFHRSVDTFWSRLDPRLSASHQFYVFLNTLKLSRKSRRAVGWRRRRAAHALPLCPRSSWTRSPATRKRRWRDCLPFKHHQGSGRAGGRRCRLSLESRTSNKWEEEETGYCTLCLCCFEQL